jgi:hypothetical protein
MEPPGYAMRLGIKLAGQERVYWVAHPHNTVECLFKPGA